MIPCACPVVQYQNCKEEILKAIQRVLENGNYILGAEVESFEQSFAAYCEVDYAVGVNSGTDALLLTLRASGIGPGDEVITVSHTAVATVAAIINSGATPVLVDIDPAYYTMDTECFQKAITPKTKAVIPVHLYGQPADMDAIMDIANSHGLIVIEDCAQAAGAKNHNRRVGSIGDAGCFSFYPTKNLGAVGDGGMVVTRKSALAERIKQIRQYGWDENRVSNEAGYNSRLDEIQAAVLNIKLKQLDADNAERRKIAQRYNEGLARLPFRLPKEKPDSTHVYHLYVIATVNRDNLKRMLAERHILTGVHYPVPVHLQGGYANKVRTYPANLKYTEELVSEVLSLPEYPGLSVTDVDLVIQSIVSSLN